MASSFFSWLFGKSSTSKAEEPSVSVMEHCRKTDKVLANLESTGFERTGPTKASSYMVDQKEFDEQLLEVRMKEKAENDEEKKEKAKPKNILEE